MARARALWRATGLTDEDFERPIVVMANSYTQFLPGRGSGPLAESRPVPAALRAFLTQRDLTCRFPGCRVPARRCDIDHTTAWADGGTTDAGNLASLCRKHHTLKHESRWQVEQLDDQHGAGVLAWTSTRGRTSLTVPGTADHVLDRLDEWATQAEHLTHQTPSPERLEYSPPPDRLPPQQLDDPPF